MPEPDEPDEPVIVSVTVQAELIDGDMVVMHVTQDGGEVEMYVLNLDEYNEDDDGG